MKRRIFSILLLAVLLCGLIPTAAATEFADVSEQSWYYESVQYVAENGLMDGVGNGSFAPNDKMTRAMLVTVLWRYCGAPQEGRNTFSDVPDGKWYTQAIAWAAHNALVNGVGEGRFQPDGLITREQMAAIFYRFHVWCGADAQSRDDLSGFSDRAQVSDWALEAVSWAVGSGLIKGDGKGINPKGNASRAEVATLLMRYIEANRETPLPPACEHSETEVRDAVEATCTTDGYTGDVCCASCGLVLSEGISVAMSGHSFADGICTVCGATDTASEMTVSVGGKCYYIGMSTQELTALAGTADETLAATAGYHWYVFGASDYQTFFMAGVENDKVVSLCASGVGFTYLGRKMGEQAPCESKIGCDIATDANDHNIFLSVHLTDPTHWSATSSLRTNGIYNTETLHGESKANFHMTNAFRVYHGKSVLTWCDKAARAAQLHSEDMAAQNYFDHVSPDGRTPGDRLSAQGITWYGYAENICAGYDTGIACFVAWVNSAGHRAGMLNGYCTHLGVGFTVRRESHYFFYSTQNFYA